MQNKLKKSSTDKALTGVCGGIADFFGISPFIVRLIFVFTNPVSLWVYIFLSASLDSKPT
ncbi:PspC domain-containing protein [Klebsiella pneumoniae]|nr:PspC domain-containing protein [Klebsiella pneumoniae]